jgi:hypothetical protein
MKRSHGLLSIIKRDHDVYHRIDKLKSDTTTLFIAYGKYKWNAINTEPNGVTGIFKRSVYNKELWCKMERGIWFIGNTNKSIAELETRHSIHQY